MMSRILILCEKYCDADPAHGPTNAESMVVAAIRSTGLVQELKHFYYDVVYRRVGREKMMRILLEDCEAYRPELIVYTPMGGLLGYELNPLDEAPSSAELLGDLRGMGIKVYSHLWDTIGREEETKIRNFAYADICGIVDSNVNRFSDDERVIQVYSAIDPAIFCRKNIRRDIEVCFIGAVDPTGQRWPQRITNINFLRSSGVNVVVAGGQRQRRLSWEEYAGYLQRSKISLNFCIDPTTGTSQIKGRVFETLACGAMLLEDDGDQTRRFFQKGKDFITFNNPKDMLEKVQHFLRNEAEREAVARSGCERVTSIYNARNMWGYIFEKMGFNLPDYLQSNYSFSLHREKLNQIRSAGSVTWE